MIVSEKKIVERKVCKTPARHVYEDTGRVEVRTEKDVNGELVSVEVPIKQKILLAAEYENIFEEVEIHSVTVEGETHEFTSLDDAKLFVQAWKG